MKYVFILFIKKKANFFYLIQKEKQKEIYDRYGKEGLTRGAGGGPSRQEYEFDFGGFGGGFGGFNNNHHFRSPHDIFEEFFGTRNIFDLFGNFFFY